MFIYNNIYDDIRYPVPFYELVRNVKYVPQYTVGIT